MSELEAGAEIKHHRRKRKDVAGGLVVEKLFGFTWNELKAVLEDWNRVEQNAREIGIKVFQDLFTSYPDFKSMFPSVANVEISELDKNEQFAEHALAVIRGLSVIMKYFSAQYEEDKEILPMISYAHRTRGVTWAMMSRLEDSVFEVICRHLSIHRKKYSCWKSVLDVIFRDYLCSAYGENDKKTETKTALKKLLDAVKSDRRNSSSEKYEVDESQEMRGDNEVNSQVTTPVNLLRKQSLVMKTSPTLSDRRPSRSLLHPDHAKLMVQRRSSLLTPPLERYTLPFEDNSRINHNGGFITSPLSSSAASSVTSISNGPTLGSHVSDPLNNYESRRSSTMTNKYSLLDALDLEYALIKAAARGSIGPYSLSQSLQKLTFTQSLAFPALARGISNKKNSTQSNTKGPLDPLDSGVNAFAKVATVLVLVLISVLVFGVLYKFIRT